MMKRLIGIMLVGIILTGCFAPTNQPNPQPTVKSEIKPLIKEESQIEELIKQLGDDDWQTREKAQKELIKLDNGIQPLLEKYKDSPNPEIKLRVARILGIVNSSATVKIQTDRDNYALHMSSAIGIGLTPILEGRYPSTVKFHWCTTYGHFLKWTYPIEQLGKEVATNKEKIYWSLDINSDKKASACISLSVEELLSGKVLCESCIEIEIDNTGHARVKK